MNQQAINNLQQIGLTEGEIKVYEAILTLGDCTKTLLAKNSGVSPSNIYDITNRLLKKGIISRVEKDGIAHFSPANPKLLLNYINDKEKELRKEREIVESLLPRLLAEYKEGAEKHQVEMFSGWQGLKRIFEELLEECKSGDENYVFGAGVGENSEQADRFFLKYSQLRAEKGINTKIIFNESIKKRTQRLQFFQKSKHYDIRFLQGATPAEIMVYHDIVCILLLLQEPLVIRIKNKHAAQSFIHYFKLMWQLAKK